ncbi:hypothetical protein PHMEG_00025971 [Phytophthora megakarya]|uniref:Uncharacterized protein n=1 Tax=Phytophthora megakarya TaxID=4795 RepID=A0A225VD88_9STRA|nr:hypothetical protein PHMEG_00025971 [Phytophthora megakarya]
MPKEDLQVGNVLNGMMPNQAPRRSSLDLFDTTRRERIYEVRAKMFRYVRNEQPSSKANQEARLPQDKVALNHHRALIEKLLDIHRKIETRLSSLEVMHNKIGQDTKSNQNDQQKKSSAETTKDVPVKKRRRSKPKPLIYTWFEWHSLTSRC